MTLLEEIYHDVVITIAAADAEDDQSLCANELRAIRNRIKPHMASSFTSEVELKALRLLNK